MQIPDHPTLLRRMIDRRLKQLAPTGPILTATLVQTERHCGKPTCRCLRGGPKHPAMHLTHKVQGKTESAYVLAVGRAAIPRPWLEARESLDFVGGRFPIVP